MARPGALPLTLGLILALLTAQTNSQLASAPSPADAHTVLVDHAYCSDPVSGSITCSVAVVSGMLAAQIELVIIFNDDTRFTKPPFPSSQPITYRTEPIGEATAPLHKPPS
ncbi:hypothetical protein ACKKBG_A02545 [Auxenochlorella protothecoides x Auxenochlorella symbiontica]